eukprot:2200258-Prorocentrum_lima.AAC.1
MPRAFAELLQPALDFSTQPVATSTGIRIRNLPDAIADTVLERTGAHMRSRELHVPFHLRIACHSHIAGETWAQVRLATPGRGTELLCLFDGANN